MRLFFVAEGLEVVVGWCRWGFVVEIDEVRLWWDDVDNG